MTNPVDPNEHYDTPDSKVLIEQLKYKLLKLEAKEKRFMTDFKYRHKITFAFIVFFAINLIWYGMWTIVSDLPLLRDPVVSLILGALILIATGYFFENMVSPSMNRKRRAKKKKNDTTAETSPVSPLDNLKPK